MTWLPPWYFDTLEALRVLARSGEPFTSDDLHDRVGEPPHHNMQGRVFTYAQKMGLIQPTGCFVPSRRCSRRKARIAEWIGAGFPLPESAPEPETRQGTLL